jgi:hypothetical protein
MLHKAGGLFVRIEYLAPKADAQAGYGQGPLGAHDLGCKLQGFLGRFTGHDVTPQAES